MVNFGEMLPESPNTLQTREFGMYESTEVLTVKNIVCPCSEVGGECNVVLAIREKKTFRQWLSYGMV